MLIMVLEKELMFTELEETTEKIGDVRKLFVEFIEDDVAKILRHITESYAETCLPQEIRLIVICCDERGKKLALSDRECDYVEYECISDAIEEANIHMAYAGDEYFETESIESGKGYIYEGCYYYHWEKKAYSHFACASFIVRVDSRKCKITVDAECNVNFQAKYDLAEEGYNVTREDYLKELAALVTDEPTVRALDKAMRIEGASKEELLWHGDAWKLSDEERQLLTAVGYDLEDIDWSH